MLLWFIKYDTLSWFITNTLGLLQRTVCIRLLHNIFCQGLSQLFCPGLSNELFVLFITEHILVMVYYRESLHILTEGAVPRIYTSATADASMKQPLFYRSESEARNIESERNDRAYMNTLREIDTPDGDFDDSASQINERTGLNQTVDIDEVELDCLSDVKE